MKIIGDVYAFCTECECVAIHDGQADRRHCWIERKATEREKMETAMICNVCAPLPDLLCESCGRIGNNVGAGYVWEHRTPTTRELHLLPKRRCPDCGQEAAAAYAP